MSDDEPRHHDDAEVDSLRTRVKRLEVEHLDCARRRRELSQRAFHLASIVSATTRLANAKTRHDVVVALEEIVVNLVGSEELAVFAVSGDTLRLIASRSIDPSPLAEVCLGRGVLGRVASRGTPFFAGAPDERAELPSLAAAVPLMLGPTVLGLLAIFNLVPHKAGLDPLDRELLAVVGMQGGLALHCAALGASRPTLRPPRGPSSHD